MKALILAGGLGTRVRSLTGKKQKTLLPLVGKPIIEHIIGKISELYIIDEILVLTINKFFEQFKQWRQSFDCDIPIHIVDIQAVSKKRQISVIGAIHWTVNEQKIKGPLLVIAGDNLFEFSLVEMCKFFNEKKGSVVAITDLGESRKLAGKFGVVQINNKNQIVDFEEKPREPKSTIAATACYIFRPDDIQEIKEYLKNSKAQDDLGEFIKWLSSRKKVFGFIFKESWFDVGNPEDYSHAKHVFGEKEKCLKTLADALLSREKVVFVFGAGASIPSGIPGSKFLKGQLLNYIKSVENTQKFQQAIKKLPKRFRKLDKAPFECLITLGCVVYGEKSIVTWLKKHIPDVYRDPIKYFPSIAYEFISHLLNNDLINYIVNLNYDELLDKAIEDEVGKDKCYRVATPEEFEKMASEEDWTKISKKYFLIKPHGTLSLPMSLRHRLEDVAQFEKDKEVTLRRIFENSIVVLVGYEANDEDFKIFFNELLLLGKIRKTIIVKNNPETVIEKFPSDIRKEKNLAYRGRSDDFFKRLSEKLDKDTHYTEYYTRATRHFIRCKLYKKLSPNHRQFTNKKIKIKSLLKKDPLFFTRLNLLLEIVIFAFKTRGLFTNTALMSCSRIVSALKDHLRQFKREVKISVVEDILGELEGHLETKPIPKTLGYAWYYLPIPKGASNLEVKELFIKSAKDILEMLNERYFEKVEKLDDFEIAVLSEMFYQLQRDFDYDLSQDYTPYFLFRNPKPVRSRIEFRREGIKLTKSNEYSNLYVATVTGEWLNRLKSPFPRNITIRILVNKDVFEIKESIHRAHIDSFFKELNRKIMSCNNAEIRGVEALKHHMTLRFNTNDKGEITEGRALYFYREGKSSSFAPVLLKTREDLQMLKKYFDTLWKTSSKVT